MTTLISVTPGFSPVTGGGESQNRFNGLLPRGNPLKRLVSSSTCPHPAKAGC